MSMAREQLSRWKLIAYVLLLSVHIILSLLKRDGDDFAGWGRNKGRG